MRKLLLPFLILTFFSLSNAQWVEQTSGTTSALYSVFAINNDVVWTCGDNATVLRTLDGGNNWANASGAGIPAALDLYHIGAVDQNVAGVLGSDASGSYMYLTTNGGANWGLVFAQTGGFFNSFFYLSRTSIGITGDPVGGRWSLFRTPNYITWDSTGMYLPRAGSEAGWNNSAFTILFPEEAYAFFGTNNGRVYRTTNGGTQWTFHGTPSVNNVFGIWIKGLHGLAVGDGIAQTTDIGDTWTEATNPASADISGITGGLNALGEYRIIAGSQIYFTSNYAETWTNEYTAPSGLYNHIAASIDPAQADAWAVRSNGGISKLTYLPVPVELTSFTATAAAGKVKLDWATATELNNYGFELERNIIENDVEHDWQLIGFVKGNGTTTESKQYSFVDDVSDLSGVSAYYRIKQLDYDGTFEYSDAVFVESIAPVNYTIEQNYPNPFNPSTNIRFGLAFDSNVKLKVFNSLGEEVSVLINKFLPAGTHKIEFDASNFNSGVYFCRIEAVGSDGNLFSESIKMILTK